MTRFAKLRRCCFLAVLCAFLLAPAAFTQATDVAVKKGTVLDLEFHSPALEGNLLGDSPRRRLQVYLPPSYYPDSERRYPTIYLLHPFAGSSRNWTTPSLFGATLQDVMDGLLASGAVREMIIVMPNGTNSYGGSMYHNSVVTGRWEDYIADDLVAFIDRTFRTVPQAAARGIAGHSMGAFGSLLLAMKRPDVFGAVYALSAPVLDFIDLLENAAAWRRLLQYSSPDEVREAYFKKGDFAASVLLAVSAAFSPNPASQPFRVDFPYRLRDGELERDEAVHARWGAHVLAARIPEYRANLARLKGIWLDYGDAEIDLIKHGSQRFAAVLNEHGIPHNIECYQGDHFSGIAERLRTRALPAFSSVLEFPAAGASRAP